jgi:hypothetical protein
VITAERNDDTEGKSLVSVTTKLIKVKRHKRHSHSFSFHFCNTVLRYLSPAKSALAPNFVTLGSFRYSYHITFCPRLHI